MVGLVVLVGEFVGRGRGRISPFNTSIQKSASEDSVSWRYPAEVRKGATEEGGPLYRIAPPVGGRERGEEGMRRIYGRVRGVSVIHGYIIRGNRW